MSRKYDLIIHIQMTQSGKGMTMAEIKEDGKRLNGMTIAKLVEELKLTRSADFRRVNVED